MEEKTNEDNEPNFKQIGDVIVDMDKSTPDNIWLPSYNGMAGNIWICKRCGKHRTNLETHKHGQPLSAELALVVNLFPKGE